MGFIVLVSDGITRSMKDGEIVRLTRDELRKGGADRATTAARRLVEKAQSRDDADDITALVVLFGDVDSLPTTETVDVFQAETEPISKPTGEATDATPAVPGAVKVDLT